MEQNIMQVQVSINKIKGGIVQPDGSLGLSNSKDFYINIPLIKTYKKIDDYINIDKDPLKTQINRQLINPCFLEFLFFETVKGIQNTNNPSEGIIEKAKQFNITINK